MSITFRPGRSILVRTEYSSKSIDPLTVQSGEQVLLGRRDEEWPGWVWCSSLRGKSGWVPESYIMVNGSSGVMKYDYAARELSVRVGEQLKVEKCESGWVWAVTSTGKTGWVPARNLEAVD